MYLYLTTIEAVINAPRADFKLSTLLGIKHIGYLPICGLLTSALIVIVRFILLFL